MASLQQTFTYNNTSNQTEIEHVSIEVLFPIFSFRIEEREISRYLNDLRIFNTSHDLSDNSYKLSLPLDKLVDTDLQDIYGFFLYHFIKILDDGQDINDYSFKFTVNIKDDYAQDIVSKEFEGLYYQKSFYSSDYDRRYYQNEYAKFERTYGPLRSPNVEGLQKLPAERSSRVFLINKEAYEMFKLAFSQLADNRSISDQFVLEFIQILVDLRGDTPKITTQESIISFTQLADFLRSKEYNLSQEFYQFILDNFYKLFDFPLEVPEIETLDVKGQFVIDSEETYRTEDLGVYDLIMEYPRKNNSLKIAHYDWSRGDEIMEENSIDFSFTKEEPLITNSIDGLIKIKVRGYDGAILWEKKFSIDDEELQDLLIRVKPYPPEGAGVNPETGNPRSLKKLRGRVIQTSNKYDLNELTVIVQAKKEGDELFRIVSATQTDHSGNFSMDYPYGEYTEAQAMVSLMPNSPADLGIDPDAGNESLSDDFIYLLLTDGDVVLPEGDDEEHEEECDCKAPVKAKRLPDQEDLIQSPEYTQDIGGSCLNLSTPNRTLREYSYNAIVRVSDPDVANYVLEKNTIDGKIKYELKGGYEKLERNIVDLDNPIRWQDAPDAEDHLSFYQAVTVATGHILHFKSVFKADGYSLGDLVYSLPLAPGQKKQIVVFESSHSLTGAESQSTTQGESLSAELLSDRFITDQLSGGINEDMSGRSQAKTSGMSAGLGVGVSYGGIGGSLGVAGGFSNSSSSASQNSSRNITQFFGEKLRQSLIQNAESYRHLNASIVTTVTEGQDYGVTAETVANHNHCHSLTMMYFEVLRHYAIFQEISHVEECVFVPLLMTNFSTENIHKWKDVIAQRLLPIPSNTYLQPFRFLFRSRQHPLLKAFDANERIKTNYSRVEYPAEGETYADGLITNIKGQITLRIYLKRPKSKYDRIKSLPVTTKTIVHKEIDPMATVKKGIFDSVLAGITGGLSLIATGAPGTNVEYKSTEEEVLVKAAIFDQFMSLDANYQTVPPAKCIRVNSFKPRGINLPVFGFSVTGGYSGEEFFEDGILDKKQWTTYASIMNYGDVYDFLEYYFAGRLIAEWDDIFENDILPEIYSRIVDSLSITQISWDLTPTGRYTGGNRKMSINISGSCNKTRRQLPDNLTITSNNSSVRDLKGGYTILNIEDLRLTYSTDYFEGKMFQGYLGNDLLDGVNVYIPLNSRDKINPRKEDRYIVNELIEHLNSNLEYYNKVLWANLDPDRRFMLLDGFNIQTYTSTGQKSVMRSLASVVKNELVTITGNSLVFPVADGFKVGRNYMLEEIGEDVFLETSLTDYYKPLTPVPPYRISVPTRGVFMEAIQGQCDACEMVKENSSQDWDKFRTEEPTGINPVVTPTPTISQYTPNYREFAPPLVNIQNAPDAPAPAAGLSQLSELLGKAGVFNDITGLAGNQENAMKTYLSNQENAKAFAEMAKSLATQQHNTQNSETISQGINQARRAGNITEEDAQNLSRQHLQQQIDGGENARESAQFEREQSRESLTGAAINAANQGQNVSAERTDSDGTSESIRIGDTESGLQDSGSTLILLDNITNETRAFNPAANSKTGVITMRATLRNAPQNYTTRWSSPTPGAVNFTSPNALTTAVEGLIPGLQEIHFSVFDSGGTRIASTVIQLSVPQFVTINEDATPFNDVLDTYQVAHLKNDILQTAKQVCDHLLRTSNVRTIWQCGPFSETLPSHLSPGLITPVIIKGDPPAGKEGLLGETKFVGGAIGSAVPNEPIFIYPGGYDDDGMASYVEVDVETRALVLQLEGMSVSDPAMEAFATKVFGRLFGETISHEIIHALIGLDIPTGHNSPAIANDIMNNGVDRNFTQRTGIVDNAHVSPVDPDNFTDNGLAAIDRLQAVNQTRMNNRFPVPPDFS
ncbi:hypothetical protein [Zunongwangia sp. H14]|uniref:hypothetical protein n=1 Tax=Zunongwangia sp. H14 TaxID=3240792 RepID=UPI003567C2B6